MAFSKVSRASLPRLMKTGKIGILGGTFDPIHLGHLHLARECLKYLNLDEVLFCPAKKNPFKQVASEVSAEHRSAMIELAIQNEPKFKFIDLELRREGPSYTVVTLQELKEHYPETQLFWLMGEDALPNFESWYQVDEIIKLAKLAIGRRSEKAVKQVEFKNLNIKSAVQEGRLPFSVLEVSSTEVRGRLSRGELCNKYLPEEVVDYISQNRLYSNV